jgi:hypothetical protein
MLHMMFLLNCQSILVKNICSRLRTVWQAFIQSNASCCMKETELFIQQRMLLCDLNIIFIKSKLRSYLG